jgi:DNA polymerase (family 10)
VRATCIAPTSWPSRLPKRYEALGLQYIEPELREGLDEIERAAAHKIPPPVTATDLSGVLHAHTTASDGADTLEAMAEASLAQGYKYIGITDHSKTAHYAGGLTIEEIEQQQAEIDRLNAAFGDRFRIFQGDRVRHPSRRHARLSGRRAAPL